MAKHQVNVRLSDATRRKLDALKRQYGTVTSAVEVAVERLYTQEVKMNAPIYEDQAEYDAAKARIDATPALEPYRDVILYDWSEGAEHWAWIAKARVAEIVDWAEGIRKDEAVDKPEEEVTKDL